MKISGKEGIKNVLGRIPFTADLYWLVRQKGKPINSHFSLEQLQAGLPQILAEADTFRRSAEDGRNVFIFATLHYWIEHAALLGIALAAQGHRVTLGFLPYADWQSPINKFDLRRQDLFTRKVLEQAAPLMEVVSFLDVSAPFMSLPEAVTKAVDEITTYDAQYTLQIEDVDPKSKIYRLRHKRNREAARTALGWLTANSPDVVIVPNGAIQELGVVYRVARYLNLPTVTYEFSDQRQRIWLAQDGGIMRQNTDALWEVRQNIPLTRTQVRHIRELFSARKQANLWKNFSRLWQETSAKGGENARQALGLDKRPVVLLPTNVLGDSLTLGRNIFSHSMARWLSRTVQYFYGRKDVQLIIRVHPGEVLTHGLSMVEVVHNVLPKLPEHIHLIGPEDSINTYDLVEVADVGLVYTTTMGLEMAMKGLPVIVTGETHYRGRGFTYDPDSWVRYFKMLKEILEDPKIFRLRRSQKRLARQYAYSFFFEFPRPFPWHLVRAWEDYKERPLKAVMSPKGCEEYGDTFRYLVGEPLDWSQLLN